MPRPTFTASEISRYVFCNLAWAIENSGQELQPEQVAQELQRLEKTPTRTAEEEQELRFLQEVQRGFARRDYGQVYHAKVHTTATTHIQRTRSAYRWILWAAVAVVVAFVLWLILHR